MAGQYQNATKAFEKAIALEPSSGSAHYNLACAYAKSGHVVKARAALDKAVALNPDYEEKAQKDKDLETLKRVLEYRISNKE